MKIISDYTDYYDHLADGQGPVLDRSAGNPAPNIGDPYYGPLDPYQIIVGFCGRLYYGVMREERLYWGKEIFQLGTPILKDGHWKARIPARGRSYYFKTEPEWYEPTNPIEWVYASVDWLDRWEKMYPYPRLVSLGFERVLSAEKAHETLENYLSRLVK